MSIRRVTSVSMNEQQDHPLLTPWNRLVAEMPDAPGVVESDSGRTWTLRELDDRAREWSEELGGYKLDGIPVAFQERNGGEWIARFLALLRVGAPAMPIDSAAPP